MAEEAYLNREDVLKILKINDEELDALVREGKLQEKEEDKFDEEDIIMYATEYPPELEEEEMKILPSVEEPVTEEKEEETEVTAPQEETAVEEEEVLSPVEEPVTEEKEEKIEVLAPQEEAAVEEEEETLPPVEEPVTEEKEEEIEILAPQEETAVEEREEPVPAVSEEPSIKLIEPEDEVKAEPGVKSEIIEEPALFEVPELAVSEKSPFFTFLSVLSFIIILASAGILALPILDIAIPEFIRPAVDFVSGLF